MPGPRLDLMLMLCCEEVGGCDLWMSGPWEKEGQWWLGLHFSSPLTGLNALQALRWPDPRWHLIGYERWKRLSNRSGVRLLEAYYCEPNPSTTKTLEPTKGHWHKHYYPSGKLMDEEWSWEKLEDYRPYLNGGAFTLKGKWLQGGKGKLAGPKGKDNAWKGKGQGYTWPKGGKAEFNDDTWPKGSKGQGKDAPTWSYNWSGKSSEGTWMSKGKHDASQQGSKGKDEGHGFSWKGQGKRDTWGGKGKHDASPEASKGKGKGKGTDR